MPRLRFPDFGEAKEWTRGKASDIVDVVQGYGFPERLQGDKKGEFPFYKVSDISACVDAGGVFLTDANNHIDSNTMAELRAKPMPVGATVFAKIGEAIRSNKRAITTRPCLVDNNTAGVKAIMALAHDRFVYYLWCQIPLIEYAGGVVPAINKSAIEQIQVSYPQIDEQQKIADCLTSLDEVIGAQGRKVEALKTHKRGLMQQLFPREGETLPRFRFPEFRNAPQWVSEPLGKAATFINGRAYAKEELLERGKYPVLRVGNFFTNDHWYYSDLELEDTKYCDNGDLLYAWSASFGPRMWQGKKTIYHYHIWKVVEHEAIDRKFLFYRLDSDTELMRARSANGIGMFHITKGTIEGWISTFPLLSEQQRIASCLSALDANIAAESKKLAIFKSHKQGLMQQLFPSPEAASA